MAVVRTFLTVLNLRINIYFRSWELQERVSPLLTKIVNLLAIPNTLITLCE